MTAPTLELERSLLQSYPVVIGLDEVGRGAIAGPVAVGAAAVRAQEVDSGFPEGLRDSKLLTEKRRSVLAPACSEWVWASAIGFSTAVEIDESGIVQGLARAAKRALAELYAQGVPVAEAAIVLDGSHDWLSPGLTSPLNVQVRPKADRDCASVAAASVLAKVERDRQMIEAADEYPHYSWHTNKGYGSAAHFAGIQVSGPSPLHRETWLH